MLPHIYENRGFSAHRTFEDISRREGTHFYRGCDKAEYDQFLNPNFDIGPHADDFVGCGRFNDKLFGFWFDPKIHDVDLRDEEIFWDIAKGLSPNHLDMRSKVKLIDMHGLNPYSDWRDDFDHQWTIAYELYTSDPLARALTLAEARMVEIRDFYRTNFVFHSNYQKSSPEVNSYKFVYLFDHTDPSHVETGSGLLHRELLSEAFVGRARSFCDQLETTLSGGFGTRGFFESLLNGLMITAFLPVPEGVSQPGFNYGNFVDSYNFVMDFDFASLDARSINQMRKNRFYELLLRTCNEPVDIERFIKRFDI